MRFTLASTALLAVFVLLPFAGAQPAAPSPAEQRIQRHNTEEWRLIEPFLPNMATASAATLQGEGDVLRARRFEEDALEFYAAALQRGGDEADLLNRIGITHLVMRHAELARADFHRVLALKPKDAQAWNNLGAAEYFSGNNRSALVDYLRAVKFNRKSALFHSNLGTAYFELKEYESASQQFQQAARLDPGIFEQVSGGGLEAHPLSANERGRFCFELARVGAQQHQDEVVLRWLRKALDAGYDIQNEMRGHSVFAAYQDDQRVRLMISNFRALRPGRLASNTPVPPLSDIVTKE